MRLFSGGGGKNRGRLAYRQVSFPILFLIFGLRNPRENIPDTEHRNDIGTVRVPIFSLWLIVGLQWMEEVVMTPKEFREWMAGSGYSCRKIERVFGISKSTVVKYRRDGSELPKWLPLAIKGLGSL